MYVLQEACEPFAAADDMFCDCEELDGNEKDDLLAQASDILASMSGFTYRGTCTETFRPRSPSGCHCMCDCAAFCRCSELPGILLPSDIQVDSAGFPLIEVWIDGEPFYDWSLVDGNLLVRTDGRSWPSCANPTIPLDEKGAFGVVVSHGDPPSVLARNAAVEIACLFVKQTPNRNRGLPMQTRSATAQGVTITFEEVDRMVKSKIFMTPWTIRFLTVYAPEGRDQVFVYSPELAEAYGTLHQTS